MLKTAGIGVAMENAEEKVKSIADITALSNEEYGFAKTLNALMEKIKPM